MPITHAQISGLWLSAPQTCHSGRQTVTLWKGYAMHNLHTSRMQHAHSAWCFIPVPHAPVATVTRHCIAPRTFCRHSPVCKAAESQGVDGLHDHDTDPSASTSPDSEDESNSWASIYAKYSDRRRRKIEERDADRLTDAERARRDKIAAANKGREPWNKGRKHSPGDHRMAGACGSAWCHQAQGAGSMGVGTPLCLCNASVYKLW